MPQLLAQLKPEHRTILDELKAKPEWKASDEKACVCFLILLEDINSSHADFSGWEEINQRKLAKRACEEGGPNMAQLKRMFGKEFQ